MTERSLWSSPDDRLQNLIRRRPPFLIKLSVKKQPSRFDEEKQRHHGNKWIFLMENNVFSPQLMRSHTGWNRLLRDHTWGEKKKAFFFYYCVFPGQAGGECKGSIRSFIIISYIVPFFFGDETSPSARRSLRQEDVIEKFSNLTINLSTTWRRDYSKLEPNIQIHRHNPDKFLHTLPHQSQNFIPKPFYFLAQMIQSGEF